MSTNQKPNTRRGEVSLLFAIVMGVVLGVFIKNIRIGLIIGIVLGVVILLLGWFRSSK